jgi:cytochrome c-type biogenesis protein
MDNVSLGIAFAAGLGSFLSPCVFPLVPAYISYLGGRAASAGESGKVNRWMVFKHGLAFILGFSVVFVLIGLAASALGALMYDLRPILMKVGGALIVVFGLNMIGIFKIPFVQYDLRPQSQQEIHRGYFSSFLMGIFFSAGWSPCVGPVLTAILALAYDSASLGQGFVMLIAYSAGLAIPFLAAGLGIGWVTYALKRYQRAMHYVEIVMGIILIAVGILLFFGVFQQLASVGQGI